MARIETIEQRERREHEIASKRSVLATYTRTQQAAAAGIARLEREIAELEADPSSERRQTNGE